MRSRQFAGSLLGAVLLILPLVGVAHGAPPVAEAVNTAPPGVVPALQQWSDGSGRLVLTSTSRIVVPSGSPSSLQDLASQVARETAELTPCG